MSEAKWIVHVLGPDDVFCAPSKEAAEALAKSLNASFARQGLTREGQGNQPGVHAVAMEHTAEFGVHQLDPEHFEDFALAMAQEIRELKAVIEQLRAPMEATHAAG